MILLQLILRIVADVFNLENGTPIATASYGLSFNNHEQIIGAFNIFKDTKMTT